jgi:hypothetical protein
VQCYKKTRQEGGSFIRSLKSFLFKELSCREVSETQIDTELLNNLVEGYRDALKKRVREIANTFQSLCHCIHDVVAKPNEEFFQKIDKVVARWKESNKKTSGEAVKTVKEMVTIFAKFSTRHLKKWKFTKEESEKWKRDVNGFIVKCVKELKLFGDTDQRLWDFINEKFKNGELLPFKLKPMSLIERLSDFEEKPLEEVVHTYHYACNETLHEFFDGLINEYKINQGIQEIDSIFGRWNYNKDKRGPNEAAKSINEGVKYFSDAIMCAAKKCKADLKLLGAPINQFFIEVLNKNIKKKEVDPRVVSLVNDNIASGTLLPFNSKQIKKPSLTDLPYPLPAWAVRKKLTNSVQISSFGSLVYQLMAAYLPALEDCRSSLNFSVKIDEIRKKIKSEWEEFCKYENISNDNNETKFKRAIEAMGKIANHITNFFEKHINEYCGGKETEACGKLKKRINEFFTVAAWNALREYRMITVYINSNTPHDFIHHDFSADLDDLIAKGKFLPFKNEGFTDGSACMSKIEQIIREEIIEKEEKREEKNPRFPRIIYKVLE